MMDRLKQADRLGLAWGALGLAGVVYYAVGVWQTWSVLPGAPFPETVAMLLVPVAVSLVVLVAGGGRLFHKRWARLMTVAMAPLLLIFALGAVASAVFLYSAREGIGISPVVAAAIVTAVFVPLGLFTLRGFFRDRAAARDRPPS